MCIERDSRAKNEQRHVTISADAIRLAGLPELLEVPIWPVRPRDGIHILHARQRAVENELLVGVQIPDAVDARVVAVMRPALDHLVERMLAFAADRNIQRGAVAKAVFGHRCDVFAARHQERARKPFSDRGDQRALDRPLAREHGREADDVGVARNPVDDIRHAQPLTDVARSRIDGPVPIQAFAYRVDDGHVVAELA